MAKQLNSTMIRTFCEDHMDQKNIEKYNRYFKEGFNGYGIDQKIFENQIVKWTKEWDSEMTLDNYLELGKELVSLGKFEEVGFAIHFIKSKRKEFSENTFDALGTWFNVGMDNWASTDVLCMLVLSSFLIDEIIDIQKLKEWNTSTSEWQRRAVPVTLNQLVRRNIAPLPVLNAIEQLMMDSSKNVQKGIGTLLRSLWKKHPVIIEDFLMKWKNDCGRIIIQYATEKMTKEQRLQFRKEKQPS